LDVYHVDHKSSTTVSSSELRVIVILLLHWIFHRIFF